MDETVNVWIEGKQYNYFKGISLEEISKSFQNNHKYPILLARVDKSLKELEKEINE